MTTITTRSGKGSPLTNDEVDANFTGLNSDKVETSGDSMTGDLSFGDNNKAIFGAGSDLQIYHDGGNSFINEGGTGSLYIQARDLYLRDYDTSVSFINMLNNGAVTLHHAGNAKLATTSTGIDVTGSVVSDGLTVDGIASVSSTNPKIQLFETDTTDLNTQIQNQAGDFKVSRLDDDAGSLTVHFEIDHSTGNVSIPSGDLDVTGTVTADGLTVDGDSFLKASGSNTTPLKVFSSSSATNNTTTIELGDFTGGGAFEVPRASIIGQRSGSGSGGLLRFTTGESSAGTLTSRLEISDGGDISFYEDTGTTAKFFWDAADERLGIGTTTVDTTLHLSAGNLGPVLRLECTDTSHVTDQAVGVIEFEHNDATSVPGVPVKIGAYAENNHGSVGLRFYTGEGNTAEERVRVDHDGNLLVGKTAAGVNSDPGFYVAQAGNFGATVDGGTAQFINRQTSDGELVQFRKDGLPVGSIGCRSSGSNLYIDTGESGIDFGGDGYLPMRNGSITDNSIDIGSSSNRYKDLYLSGGVYLGGTGSANKLDDYEEGTWTPTIIGSTSGSASLTVTQATYTKIGNTVRVACFITGANVTGLSGAVRLAGLPFSVSIYAPTTITYCNLFSFDEADGIGGFTEAGNTYVNLVFGSSKDLIQSTSADATSGTVMFSAVYNTAS